MEARSGGAYGAANNFSPGFGGAGACGQGIGRRDGLRTRRRFGGYSAQTPLMGAGDRRRGARSGADSRAPGAAGPAAADRAPAHRRQSAR